MDARGAPSKIGLHLSPENAHGDSQGVPSTSLSSNGGDVSSLLYVTPPPPAEVGRRPRGGGDWRGGFRVGRGGGVGWGGSRWGDLGLGWVGGGGGGHRLPLPPLALHLTIPSPKPNLQPLGLATPAIMIGLNKIPQISFMAAFATSLLSILDPNTHCNPSLG